MGFPDFGFGSGSSIRQENWEYLSSLVKLLGEWLAKPYQNAEVPEIVIASGTILFQAPM